MTRACESCGARVWWAVVEGSGERMPVDWEPVAGGNVAPVSRDPVIVRVLSTAAAAGPALPGLAAPEPAPLIDQRRWVPHWATCPQAQQWRGSKRRRRGCARATMPDGSVGIACS